MRSVVMGYRTPGQKGLHQTEIPATAVGFTRRVNDGSGAPTERVPALGDFYTAPRKIGDLPRRSGNSRSIGEVAEVGLPSGYRGMGMYNVWQVTEKYNQVAPIIDALAQGAQAAVTAAQAAMGKVQALNPAQPAAVNELGQILADANAALNWANNAKTQAAQLNQQFGGSTTAQVSYSQSDDAWKQIDALGAQAGTFTSNAGRIPTIVSSATAASQAQAQQAAAAAQQQAAAAAQQQAAAAAQQQSADTNTVQRARSSSLSLMNSGNFDGALAALQTQAVQDAASRIGYDLSADVAAITSAKQRATDAATSTTAQKQAAADRAIVDQARSRSLALMAGENYDGALAVLQATDVQAAASRIGFDLTGDLVAIATAQKQAGARTASTTATQQSINDCNAAGGDWTGSRCDMTRAQAQSAAQAASDKVNVALDKAQALTAAGSFRAALMVLTGVASDARRSGREDDVNLLVAQIKEDQAEASCNTRGGTWDGSYCAMPAPMAPPPPEASAPAPIDPQVACIQAGGQWDGTSCAMPPPSWISQLLSGLFSSPAPAPVAAAPGLAPVSQGPSMQQLQAIAILKAFGGTQGQALADALADAMAPQGNLQAVSNAPPDGTPCAIGTGRRRTSGIYQGGECLTASPPSGFMRGAPGRESF